MRGAMMRGVSAARERQNATQEMKEVDLRAPRQERVPFQLAMSCLKISKTNTNSRNPNSLMPDMVIDNAA